VLRIAKGRKVIGASRTVLEVIEASILSIMLWLPIVLLLLMRMREISGETLLLPVEGRGTVD
jgi:hypothetical protein